MYLKFENFLFFVLICCLCQNKSTAAPIPPRFRTLGIENGLSNNSVRTIIKDSKGLMWFGTRDGLNRYDGYEFKVYRNNLLDSFSLPHNFIYALEEDGKHNIWVGTGQGIGVFNTLSSKFLPVYLFNAKTKKKQKIKAQITVIRKVGNGDILIGTNSFGLMVKGANENFARQINLYYKNKKVSNFTVTAIKNLNNSQVLLFVEPIGLCLYDVKTRKFEMLNSQLDNAYCMETDKVNNVWLSNQTGLYLYQLDKKILKAINTRRPSNSPYILDMFYSNQNTQLWTGTKADGIQVIDGFNGTVLSILAKGQTVYDIFEDEVGRKWVATSRNGIYIIEPKSSIFLTVSQEPAAKSTLSNNYVSTFLEMPQGKLMIGTDDGGISVWDRKSNSFFNIKSNVSDPASLSGNSVTDIKEDSRGDVWVGTFGGGLNKLRAGSWNFDHYKLINYNNDESDNVWQILETKDKTLWVTTFSQGSLYFLDRKKDKFEIFDRKFHENLFAISEDWNGVMWAGNANYLIKIDRKNLKYLYTEIGKPVRVIYEDTDGNFWLGTEGGGLILFDRKKNKIVKRFSTDNGLPSNSILSIRENKRNGDLWISTPNGLSKFDVKKGIFYNFYADDGLQSNQFLDNSSLILRSGEFVFGGVKGFSIFHPDSVSVVGVAPPLIVNDIRINNVSVSVGNPCVVQTNFDQITKLEVPYTDASIEIDFAALEYSLPGKILYSYYMEGWDKSWNKPSKHRSATYTKLDYGSYKLRIRSTDTQGRIANNEKIIYITILPPWYRTWWAYGFYLLFGFCLIYFLQNYRNKQRQLKHEIEIANLKMEREKDLNEKKLNFFTNISHELRTPLTMIVNPIKDIISKKNVANEQNDLNMVYRNAKRLLSLVDQLLLFRKMESENDPLIIKKIDLNTFSKEVFLCFNYLASQNEIDYRFECEEEALFIYADPGKIEIILFNLISNALKFTPFGGSVKLTISSKPHNVVILISDSGPGIPVEVGDKIFDKFFNAASRESLKMGFGIGLYLAKNFVELHQGTLEFNSVPGQGTVFSVILPTNMTHNEQQDPGDKNELMFINELMVQEPEAAFEDSEGSGNLELLISDLNSILVIDDNPEITEYINQILKERFKIYVSSDGANGLKLCKEYLPDIVVSDVYMPGLNGLELCSAIKKDPLTSHIPVILLTGDPSPELKLEGIETGAYDFISKPFDKEIFIAKINGIIKNRSNLQSYFFNEITLKSDPKKVNEEDKHFIQACISIIEDNLLEDSFNVKVLSEYMSMSHSKLYKKIKSISGQSANAFIRSVRLRKAAELLINSNHHINQTALRVGISDTKYFREHFYNLFKLTPSAFRKKHQKNFYKSYRIDN
ncbi:two-component regulator propeller domain-containing protein [Pedobacter sp. BG31]|uniref:hybrid sensor histidine kinase/response regulator transcription factor n=1 Tax=Pedobacter sp. BG31 TaxID=3349697 RepID=UPI0035F3BAD1